MTSAALSSTEVVARRSVGSAQRRFLIGRVLTYAALIVAVLLVLFPIYWMAIRKPPSDSSLLKLSSVKVFGHSDGTR